MRSAAIPLLAGLLGALLGALLGDLLRDPVPVVPEPEALERPAEATAADVEPTLVGLPAPATPTASSTAPPATIGSGPRPEDLEVLELLPDGGIEEFLALEIQLDPTSGDHRGWHALLTLYALAGRLDDWQRVVPRALEAGLDPDALLGHVGMLPVEKQVAALDFLLERFSDRAWTVATVADLYVNAGATERAVDVLVPALEAGVNVSLAERLVAAAPDRAARVLGALTSGEGWTAEMLGRIGGAFVAAERPDLALLFLQDALAKEPASRDVLMSLHEVDPTLALGHARALTEQYADRADVWTWLAQLEAESGHGDAAFEAWRRAAEIELTTEVLFGMMSADPERAYEAAAELSAGVTNDEVLGAVAKVTLKSGRADDTLAALLRAHACDPSDHEWMTALVALAPEQAAEALGRTAATYGGESRDEVLGAHGNALLAVGQADAAYERYREAFELDPSDWEWQRGLARADPERAVPLLEARRAEAGDEGDLLGALADAYAGTGRREEALDLYQRAIDAGAGAEWWPRMAALAPERAVAGLRAHVEAASDAGAAWGALGDLYRAQGDREAARDAYDKARALESTSLVYEIRYRQMGG